MKPILLGILFAIFLVSLTTGSPFTVGLSIIGIIVAVSHDWDDEWGG